LSVGCGPKAYTHQKDRTIFSDPGCKLYAWSSRGVVVIKDNADAVDLMFLGIDRLILSWGAMMARSRRRIARRLLIIGGKWWASEWRAFDVWRHETSGHLKKEDELTEEELRRVVF
jgi:hypothetical protein